MTIWVLRDGQLVEKHHLPGVRKMIGFPTPMISRIEAYESPVSGETISSWRQRDADMQAADACDPRDLDRKPFEKRKQDVARPADDIWTDPA